MSGMAIVTKLLQTPGSDISGLLAADKVFLLKAAEIVKPPYQVVSLVAGTDELTLSGQGEYFNHRVRVETIALTASQAEAIGDAAFDTLKNTINQVVGSFKDVNVVFCGPDFYDNDDMRTVIRRVQEFRVRCRRQ